MLLLSKDSLAKISRIIGDTPAYIVGGYPGFQDITLAVKLNLAFLSGNPVANHKFASSYFMKRFLHLNNFPYMVFSQKMKKDKDIELNLAKMVAAHPLYSYWKFEIDGEDGGRGSAILCVDNVALIQNLKKAESEEERMKLVPDLKDYFKDYVDGYITPSCPRLYYDIMFYRDVLASKGGYVEAMPKGNISTIGVVCFVSPSGKLDVN